MYGDGTIKAISKLENQDITSKAIFIIGGDSFSIGYPCTIHAEM